MPISGHSPGNLPALSPQILADVQADTRRSWAVNAPCTKFDPEIFYPPADHPAADARKVCADCTVQDQCLAYSVIADEPFGIWGGLDHRQRHALRRQLQRHGKLPSSAADSTA